MQALNKEQRMHYDLLCQSVRAIPAPVETAAMVRRRDGRFHSLQLAPTGQLHRYQTGAQKAAALGIYGADMAYCNLYHEHYRSMGYLRNVRQLCQDLHVDQDVDFDNLSSLITSAGNLDSLLGLITLSFDKLAGRMQAQGQLNLSILVAAGSWTEGTYLLARAAERTGDAVMAQKVGEQQLVLGQLIALLEQVRAENEHTQGVYDAMVAVKKAYQGVSVTTSSAGATRIEQRGGVATFIDTRHTVVNITQAQLHTISQAVAEAREEIAGASPTRI